MEEIRFKNVFIERFQGKGIKDKVIFIFNANKAFLESDAINNFRGIYSKEMPNPIVSINMCFEVEVLHYEKDIMGHGRKLIVENDYEFTLVAKDLEYKGQVTPDILHRLEISSLRDIDFGYYGKLYLACLDEDEKRIYRVLSTDLELVVRKPII